MIMANYYIKVNLWTDRSDMACVQSSKKKTVVQKQVGNSSISKIPSSNLILMGLGRRHNHSS